jgi:2-methylisocitrate lyase-like PEP mutase family enzyme
MTSQKQNFRELHNQTRPLIIGNVWNAQSAKIYEKLNLQAIGTSSAAIAHSLGSELLTPINKKR